MATAMTMPAPHESTRRHPFFWIALCIGALLLGFYLFAGLMIFRYGALSRDLGWRAERSGEAWYATQVDQNGAGGGKLQAGDRIIAINDDTRVGRAGPNAKAFFLKDPYTIRIARGSAEQQFHLDVPVRRDSSYDADTIS